MEVDPDLADRWESFTYRRLMGITLDQYLDTPAHTVQWDLAMARTEGEAQQEQAARERNG